MPFTGSTVPPFLRYGVSHSLLSDTRPLAANEKDPSASLGMTIREECVSHTLFLCMMHEISIPYTVISSAVEKSSLHSVLPCPFRGRLPILLCHTCDAIPVCQKDLGLRSGWRCVNTVPSHFPSTFPVITIRAERHQHSRRFYFLCAAPPPWTRQPEP